jgi:Gpi18-like mannosyltransferase
LTERRLIDLWVGLRIFTLILASFAALLRPLTDREKHIPVLPPSAPFFTWLERVVIAPWERWDAIYYAKIVHQGYRADDGTAQFHPLFPMLARPFFWSPMLGLMLVSSIASLLFVVVYFRLASLDIPNAETSTKLMLSFPASFILFAPYTESLWLLFAALSFWYARKDEWWASGASGALATLSRQQGIFLFLPLAYELWLRRDKRCKWQPWAALALIPLALTGWIAYRAVFLSDFHPDFTSFNSLLYTTVLAPSATKVVQEQAMLPPWEALGKGIQITQQLPQQKNVINLLLGAMMLLFAMIAWKRMRISYRILVVVLFLVAFSYHTGPDIPYMGLPRHLLLAFPVFIGAAPPLERWKGPIAAISIFGMVYMTLCYVLEAFVP